MGQPFLFGGEMVVCFGELVMDEYEIERETYVRYPGGSPLNVAVGLARWGVPVELWGVVGADSEGDAILAFLKKLPVNFSSVIRIAKGSTRRVKIELERGVKKRCYPLNHPSADQMVSIDCFDLNRLNDAKLIHFTAVPLLSDNSATALKALVENAKSAGCLISFDPNISPRQIEKSPKLREKVTWVAERTHFIKLTPHLANAIGAIEREKWADWISDKVVFLTEDEHGGSVRIGERCLNFEAVKVSVVDTNGAGDAFLAGVYSEIYKLLPAEPFEIPDNIWQNAVQSGLKLVSKILQRRGANATD